MLTFCKVRDRGVLQISSNFALARCLSANQGREMAQNRNIDPRDSVVKDLTATGAMLARLSQFGLAWPGPALASNPAPPGSLS